MLFFSFIFLFTQNGNMDLVLHLRRDLNSQQGKEEFSQQPKNAVNVHESM